MNFEYLNILVVLFAVAYYLERKNSIHIFKNRKQAIYFSVIAIIIGVVWDQIAIMRGHWSYPKGGSLGIFIGYMPLEDYFFIFVVYFFALTLYQVIRKKIK